MGIAGRRGGPSRDHRSHRQADARGFRGSRLRHLRVWSALLLFLGLLAVPTTFGGGDTAQAAPVGCSTGTGGPYAAGICWLDLSSVVPTSAGPPSGQAVSLDVGGAQLTMNVQIRPGSPAPTLAPAAFPVWQAAAIGGTTAPDSAYHGVTGLPALGTTAANINGHVLTLSDISLTVNGVPQSGYRFVIADAESTGPGESIDLTSTSSIDHLADVQPAGWAAPCSGGASGIGTTSVTCAGSTGGNVGASLFVTTAPTQIDVSMNSTGGEAVAFGLIRAAVSGTAVVAEPAAPGDTVTITAANGVATTSATTTGTGPAPTGELAAFVGEGTSGTASFHAAVNSTTSTLADYTLAWSCTQDGAPLAVTPSPDGADVAVPTTGGGLVTCTVTATAARPFIVVTGSATPTAVTAAGTTVTLSYLIDNQSPRAVAAVALALSSFTGSGTTPLVSCPGGILAPGASVTCTATYAVSQADVDAGGFTVAATLSALPEQSTTRVSYAAVSVAVAIAHAPGLDLTTSVGTTVDTNRNGVVDVGDTAPFSYVITNTGNVTLRGVGVVDPAATGAVPCGATDLAPGASTTCGPIDHAVGAGDLVASPTGTVAP